MQRIVSDLSAIVLGGPYEPLPPYQDRPMEGSGRAAFMGPWVCEGGPDDHDPGRGGATRDPLAPPPPAQPLWAQSDTLLFYPQDWATIVVGRGAGSRTLTYQAMGTAARCALRTQG